MAKRRRPAPPERAAPPKATPDPILSLDTLAERRTVLIDGKRYELRHPGELSLIDYHRIGKQSARVDSIFGREEELTDEEAQAVSSSLDELCRFLLFAPDALHKRLNDHHRMSIVMSFTGLQREAAGGVLEGAGEEPPSTGESTSPD